MGLRQKVAGDDIMRLLTFCLPYLCVCVYKATDSHHSLDPLGRLDQDAAALAALRDAVSRRADR